MSSPKNDLRPDAKGKYRPYLGWKIGEDGVRRQHRFNLGTDHKEAEARMPRLRELWAETEKLGGDEPIWPPFCLYATDLIAKGIYKIPYPYLPGNGRAGRRSRGGICPVDPRDAGAIPVHGSRSCVRVRSGPAPRPPGVPAAWTPPYRRTPGSRRRAARRDISHQYTLATVETKMLRQLGVERLDHHTQASAMDDAVLGQLPGEPLRQVDWNRKTNALVTTAKGIKGMQSEAMLQRRYILHVIDTIGGNRTLGLDRKTLYGKLHQYGVLRDETN